MQENYDFLNVSFVLSKKGYSNYCSNFYKSRIFSKGKNIKETKKKTQPIIFLLAKLALRFSRNGKERREGREGERRRNRMKIASSISPKSNYTVAGLKIEGTGSEILRSRRTKSSPSCVPRRRSEASQTETEQRERERERARSSSNVS